MSRWNCAVGTVHYEQAHEGETPGTIIYLKPALTGDEPTDVRHYAAEHPEFPHQSTADQAFDEAQFESYRRLGFHIARKVLGAVRVRDGKRAMDREEYFVAMFLRPGANLGKGRLLLRTTAARFIKEL